MYKIVQEDDRFATKQSVRFFFQIKSLIVRCLGGQRVVRNGRQNKSSKEIIVRFFSTLFSSPDPSHISSRQYLHDSFKVGLYNRCSGIPRARDLDIVKPNNILCVTADLEFWN